MPFTPWRKHPVALLGDFQTYEPAASEAAFEQPLAKRRRGAPPPLLRSHAVYPYGVVESRRPDALNPGWCPTVHVFQLTFGVGVGALLAEAATAQSQSSAGLAVSNRGGWHSQQQWLSQTLRSKDSALIAAARCLRLAVSEAVAQAEAAAPRPDVPPCTRDGVAPLPRNSWANVVRGQHFHGLHTHDGNVWAGVFYAAVPSACEGASGALLLRVACGGGSAAKPCGEGGGWASYAAIEPEQGMLVLFPGWLPHAVAPLGGATGCGEPRVAVSFNVGRCEVPSE